MSELDQIKKSLLALVADFLGGKDKNEITVIIDREEVRTESTRILITIDTAADGWTAVTRFDPFDEAKAKKFIPYTLPPAQVYLGGKLVNSGILYLVGPRSSTDGRRISLGGWSPTADIIDSTINMEVWNRFPNAKFERNNVTLADRAKELLEPFEIQVIDEANDLEPFDRVAATPDEKIFDHLAKLATQRGILISCTAQGELRLTRANTTGKPIGTIEETDPPQTEMEATFDGRKRFSTYRAIGQSPAVSPAGDNYQVYKTATAQDPGVSRTRFLAFTADNAAVGNIQKAADWKRNRVLADAYTIPFPVSSWYAPNDELWTPNTLITVKSPTLFLPNGFDFLIRAVVFDEKPSAILYLIPPQVYSQDQIVDPWAAASPTSDPSAGLLDKLQSQL